MSLQPDTTEVQNASETGSQPSWISVAEAARSLGISETAVRKRVRAGTLAARGNRGATQVQVFSAGGSQRGSEPSQPEFGTEANLEIARLAGENAELRARLADTQADRDRWHANATATLERYNHDMQEMRALLGREQAIALSATSTTSPTDVPQDVKTGSPRGDVATEASQTLPASPAPQASAVRRWWRRLIGAE